MPVIKVEEIKVIGNVIENFQRERRFKLQYVTRELAMRINKENPICPICEEKMESPLGLYNGCSSSDGDDDKCQRIWEFECKNFHNCSWCEEF